MEKRRGGINTGFLVLIIVLSAVYLFTMGSGKNAVAEKILEKACVEKVVMEQEAKVRCAEMVARAKTESQAYWTQISQRLEELGLERADLNELLQQMPKE